MKTTAETIKDQLLTKGKTVSTAESITAGHLQSELASVSGSSKTFRGGITAYKLSIKVKLLNVDIDLGHDTDCVDEEVARQMAVGALKLFKTDYAIATCGYAEPYLEQDIEEPFAWIAIAEQLNGHEALILYSGKLELTGDRIATQKQAAHEALKIFKDLICSAE